MQVHVIQPPLLGRSAPLLSENRNLGRLGEYGWRHRLVLVSEHVWLYSCQEVPWGVWFCVCAWGVCVSWPRPLSHGIHTCLLWRAVELWEPVSGPSPPPHSRCSSRTCESSGSEGKAREQHPCTQHNTELSSLVPGLHPAYRVEARYKGPILL